MSFPFPTQEITEGSLVLTVPALALYAKSPSEYIPSKAPVFYNPRMELNRDAAVLALRVYQRRVGRRLRICDPLTGCGVRGLRFLREVEAVEVAVLNDLNSQAVRLAQFNAEKNGLSDRVVVENSEARALLLNYAAEERFDAVDLDPYGSPSPFMDSALTALRNEGILAVTATDTAPLCGVNPKACIRKYFGKPLRTEYCHELGLRLLIGSVAFSAARHDLGVNVLFSHSTDHYLRVYVQVKRGAECANDALAKIGYVLHCFNCLNRKWVWGLTPMLDRRCEVCGGVMDVAGPLWLGSLADEGFCAEMRGEFAAVRLGSERRLRGLLSVVAGEAEMPPTYFAVDKVCGKLGLRAASRDRVMERLAENGYRVARTHFSLQGIRTDASIKEVKEAVKASV